MKSRYLVLVLSFFFILLPSCQVQRQAMRTPVERKHSFNATFDRIWTTMIKVLSDDGYPFKIMEKSSGILQTDNMNLDAETAYSYSTTKSSAGATYQAGTINLKFFVQSNDSMTTTVQITPYMQATFFVYKVLANVNENHVLESNGTLEKSLFDKIQGELK